MPQSNDALEKLLNSSVDLSKIPKRPLPPDDEIQVKTPSKEKRERPVMDGDRVVGEKLKILYEECLEDIQALVKEIGRIYTGLSNLQTRIDLANKPNAVLHRIEHLHDELLKTLDGLKVRHEKYASDVLDAQVKAFLKESTRLTELEVKDATVQLRGELNKAVSELIKDKFIIQSDVLSKAIGEFEDGSRRYKSVVDEQSRLVKDATSKFTQSMDGIRPLGLIDAIMIATFSSLGAVGMAMIFHLVR